MPVRPVCAALLALVLTGGVTVAAASSAQALAPQASSVRQSTPARQVAADPAPAQYVYQPVTPARILDTRSKLGGAPATAGSTIHLQVAGRAGVPTSGVGAVVIKITALSSPQGGYLTAWADGAAQPNTASVNFPTGQAAGNLAVVPLGTDGKISIRNGAAGTVNITGDVSG